MLGVDGVVGPRGSRLLGRGASSWAVAGGVARRSDAEFGVARLDVRGVFARRFDVAERSVGWARFEVISGVAGVVLFAAGWRVLEKNISKTTCAADVSNFGEVEK